MTEAPRETFLEACGFTGPLELLVRRLGASGGGRRCLLEQPFALIGRDPRTDLCLDSPEVSRRHAYFQVVAGHLFCLDLGSRSGTYWEGKSRPSGWLAPGGAIRIGPFEVRLVSVGRRADEAGTATPPDWNPMEARAAHTAAGQAAHVECSRGGKTRARCRLTRVLTLIGRAAACRLHLRSLEVSRYHCSLLCTQAGVWAVDLQGKGGIRVGGMRLPWARLSDADRLEVGGFVIRLGGVSPARPAPAQSAANGPGLPEPVRPPATLLAPSPPVVLPQRQLPDAELLAPVLQQMGMMQQQMFDQFQQAMMTMVRMFGALHHDQMGLIRDELDRMRVVTDELQTLRAELAARPSAAAAAATTAAANGAPAVTERPPGKPAEPHAEGTPRPQATAGPGPIPAAAMPAGQDDASIHLWLSERIASLEQERQSHWQKIMSFVLGK
jgi:pSer/pThr/pTyr-binding forkhead associated (FHA) protein